MRTRNSIPTYFYTNPAYRKLSSDARSLLIYLNTNAYTNLLGCYHLPLNIIEDELQWENVRVVNSLDDLINHQLVEYNVNPEWIWVRNTLAWNPIHSESLAQGLARCFWFVPPTVHFFKALVTDLHRHQGCLTIDFIHQLRAIKKRRNKAPEHVRVTTLKLLKKATENLMAMQSVY